MPTPFEQATSEQYHDDRNLAARQALFDWLTVSTPLPSPLSDMSSLSGKRVLDVGCGNGRFLARASAAGATTFGSDLSFGMAQSARKQAAAPTLQSDAHHLPFADDAFDAVLALWMIYHLDDKPTALAEIARVLAPDGSLVATANTAGMGRLDDLVLDALAEQLGTRPDHWYAPSSFHSANGEAVLREVFAHVAVHPFGSTFTVTDAKVLVGYVNSLIEPIVEEQGAIDVGALLHSIGQAAAAEIEDAGAVRIERTGTVFIATP